MDAQEYAIVIKSVCSKLNIKVPDNSLIRNVTTYCKGLNLDLLKINYINDAERYEAIARSYLLSIAPSTDEPFDISNYLKKAPKRSELLTTTWVDERMPIVSSKSMSVYIDSRVRNVDSTAASITDFVFTLVPRQTRSEIGDGRIQARVLPSQITYMKIGRIVLPYDEIRRRSNYANEITLTFTALRSNGIIAREDTYHFVFTYEVKSSNTDLVELIPVNEYCKFSPPLRMIDNLSLRFNDPIYPISFPNDRLRPTSFNYLSSDGRIQFDTPHMLSSRDVIIIMGLTTDNDAANKTVLSAVNNPRGIAVTHINDNTISTGIDFTQIVSPQTNSAPLILVYSRMFRFPIEIGYQDVSELL